MRVLSLGAAVLLGVLASRQAACASAVPSQSTVARGRMLDPVSGADGRFERRTIDGREVAVASAEGPDRYSLYIYFRAPPDLSRRKGTLYLELEYRDVGEGALSVQYNASGADAYRRASTSYGKLLGDTRAWRKAFFRLDDVDLRGAQNLDADLRVAAPSSATRLQISGARMYVEPPDEFRRRHGQPWLQPYEGPRRDDVDATTLHGKVICGYQGWFRCPGDGTEEGWVHWSRSRSRIAPDTLTFDMWPDVSELGEEERYPAPGFARADGSRAELFSSANPRTVLRHFEWMREHGIDGAEVQRFVVGLRDPAGASRILAHARAAANRTGRVFNVGYDLSGADPEDLYELIARDWAFLVEEMRITEDPRYLHHEGKPVVAVFGFYPERFDGDPSLPNRIIDLFLADGGHATTLVGGCPWYWRRIDDAGWPELYRRFDVVRPWNVGNVSREGERRYASTGSWRGDLAAAREAGKLLMPVIYPGFSWDNLKREEPGATLIPRLGGEFLWRQFHTAATLRVDTVFVAMFDEVDEGTAIFKVTNDPPRLGHFVTYDDLPSDWYLHLTGEGTRMLRGERPLTAELPARR